MTGFKNRSSVRASSDRMINAPPYFSHNSSTRFKIRADPCAKTEWEAHKEAFAREVLHAKILCSYNVWVDSVKGSKGVANAN